MCKSLNKLHKQTQYTYEQGRYPSPPYYARTAFLSIYINSDGGTLLFCDILDICILLNSGGNGMNEGQYVLWMTLYHMH